MLLLKGHFQSGLMYRVQCSITRVSQKHDFFADGFPNHDFDCDDNHDYHDSTELRQQYDEAQLQISGYQKHIDNCTEEMCE